MTHTVFLTIIILIVGIILREQLYQIKKFLKRKELLDICKYLNTEKIYIRDVDCNCLEFRAHLVKYVDSNDDIIVIDIVKKKS